MTRARCRVCVPRRLSQLQASAEALLELPDALFTGPLVGRPLACQEARRQLVAVMDVIEQLKQAVDRAEQAKPVDAPGERSADSVAWELDPRTMPYGGYET